MLEAGTELKRYRPLLMDFDFTSRWLELAFSDSANEGTREMHQANIEKTIDNLKLSYGAVNIEQKIENLITIGSQELSVLSYHNEFHRQARAAFVIGSYYPALAGICALGERILNHLVIQLRGEYFNARRDAKRIGRSQTLTDWKLMIDTLARWEILRPEVAVDFHALAQLRNDALHFNPTSLEQHRSNAVSAIKLMNRIASQQFGILNSQPWYIPDTPGASFVKKEWEENAFVRIFILPACALVGPDHRLEIDSLTMRWKVHDEQYPDEEISDEQFRKLFTQKAK